MDRKPKRVSQTVGSFLDGKPKCPGDRASAQDDNLCTDEVNHKPKGGFIMSKRGTIGDIVLEVILTHPDDFISTDDIVNQVDGKFSLIQVRGTIQRLKKHGYIKTVKEGSGSLGPAEYKILTREKKPRKKPTIKKPASTTEGKGSEVLSELSMKKTGEVIYYLIHDLKKQFHELSTSYGDLQSVLNKEKASFRITLQEKEKQIKELKENLEVLKQRLRDQHNGNDGKTLKLGEVVTFVKRRQQ